MTPRERMEAMRVAYESATGPYRKTIRQRARALARYARIPCPDWCSYRHAKPLVPIDVPNTIPEALVRWRERTRGAAIRISRAGVELHALGEETLCFDSIEAAVRAVTC